jgi:hypothetical protein
MVIECIFIGFLSAIGWWGANYYVITPYLPEPVFKEKKAEIKTPEVERCDGHLKCLPAETNK